MHREGYSLVYFLRASSCTSDEAVLVFSDEPRKGSALIEKTHTGTILGFIRHEVYLGIVNLAIDS